MARGINLLTAQSVKAARCTGPKRTKIADGQGLFLIVSTAQAKSWAFFYSFAGTRREMSLGSLADVTLAQAREAGKSARAKLRDGIDPLAEKAARLEGEKAAEGATFGEVANGLLDSLEAGWKNPKHRQQWRNTLKTYCKPIWDTPVASVDTQAVLSIISPLWQTKGETARKLRGRIERVLAAAKVLGHRAGENPARWKEHLEVLLPRTKRVRTHYPAMPYAQIPAFIRFLRRQRGHGPRALEFLILNANRTAEVIGAKWGEIDLDRKVWTIPAARMKEGREHRVALSDGAMGVLRMMAYSNIGPGAYVFPGQSADQPLSNMTMEMLMRRNGYDDYTVHGFRSTFRDWAGDETDHPREVAEAALSHAVGNEVELSYRRGDALEKRRLLMEEWSAYCFRSQLKEVA